MKRFLCSFLVLFCFFILSVEANNVRMDAKVKVIDVSGGVATLEIPLQWDNSWHDALNWDAVWMFLKYKNGAGAWKHVVLQNGGHLFSGDFTCSQGKTGNDVMGIFVYRSTVSSGDASTVCTLKWKLPSELADFTVEKYENNDVFLKAQAIEMVYVPYGAYALGDGISTNSFITTATGEACVITKENETLSLEVNGGGTVSALPAAYPKGFAGFYVMKYEVSQEQYVKFLNSLTLNEQKALLPNLPTLLPGQYVFGTSSEPTKRNGIILARRKGEADPVIFANNLTNDSDYGIDNDGRTVACNYMSITDLLSYCSWAGLRPMSELEYEKSCRQLLPRMPLGAEYAWGDATGANGLTAVVNSKTRNEMPQNGNVNAGGSFNEDGPVRCGAFAALKNGRTAAGATFWGVMEMSGNVRELCYNTSGSITRNVHGDGTVKPLTWGAVNPSQFGFRGGSFAGNSQVMRVSDRSEIAGMLVSETTREATVGFRAVRSFDTTGIRVDPGVIAAAGDVKTVCTGSSLKIGGAPATATIAGLNMKYSWYVNGTLIPDADQVELIYNGFNIFGTYKFQRQAVCAVGEATTTILEIKVVSADFSITPNMVLSLDRFNTSTGEFIATPKMKGGSFIWSYNGNTLVEGVQVRDDSLGVYWPAKSNFGIDTIFGRNLRVECVYKNGGCLGDVQTVEVKYVKDTLFKCGFLLVDKRDGQRYRTTQIGAQCWMADNINIGNQVPCSVKNMDVAPNVINKYCYLDVPSNCAKYGGMYTWYEGTYAEKNTTKMNGSFIQGICPEGWHVPVYNEWSTLTSTLGNTPARWQVCSWSNAANCNSSGLNVAPLGFVNYTNSSHLSFGSTMYFWVSNSQHCINMGSGGIEGAASKYWGMYIRCLKN